MYLTQDATEATMLADMVNQGVGNFRMTEMQAALGISQLKRLDELVARRREIGHRYVEAGLCPDLGPDCVWNVAPLFCREPVAAQLALQAVGVDARLPRPALATPEQARFVMLPLYPLMSPEQIELVIEAGKCVKEAIP